MRVISPDFIPLDALVADAGGMGAPTVGLEKLDSDQDERAVEAVIRAMQPRWAGGQKQLGHENAPPHLFYHYLLHA